MKTAANHYDRRSIQAANLSLLLCLVALSIIRVFYIPTLSQGNDQEQALRAVIERHQDPGVARYCRETDGFRAREQLSETISLIKKHYYQQVSIKDLLSKSLQQLLIAMDTPLVAEQFQVSLTQLAAMKERLTSQQQELLQRPDCDTEDILSLATVLIPTSQQTGLGSAWPGLELSYALAKSLDDYSYVLTPDQYQSLQDRLGGMYVGIGVDLIFEGSYPTLFDVIEDSPAAKAGARSGDLLIAINQASCRGQESGIVSAMLTGKANSTVRLMVRRGQQDMTLTASRNIIAAPSVRYAQVINTPNYPLGYLRIASFDNDTAMEMRRQIDRLIPKGIRGLLIDLRSNGGGIMTSAIDAVRLFISEGTIVTVCSNNDRSRYCAGGIDRAYSLPLAILVDKNTASAAEIFAAALKDNHRATIIGNKTFGKALVQTLYSLKAGATALCLTTASYLPPSSTNLQHVGILPDIIISSSDPATPPSVAQFLSPDDPTLHQAMELLMSGPTS